MSLETPAQVTAQETTSPPTELSSPESNLHQPEQKESLNGAQPAGAPAAAEPSGDAVASRIALLFLEDFVVTALLRQGRPLRGSDLSSAAEGFRLPRNVLRDGLRHSKSLVLADRDWQLEHRLRRSSLSREERSRQPLESTLDELLLEIGKPMPTAIIERELSYIRSDTSNALRDVVRNVLRSTRTVLEVTPESWLHREFILETALPDEEVIVRENQLSLDPDYPDAERLLQNKPEGSTLVEQAQSILMQAGRPLSQRMVGFILWRNEPGRLNAETLARALNDRSIFAPLIHGFVTLQAQLPRWRSVLNEWVNEQSGLGFDNLDIPAMLRQRVPAAEVHKPRDDELVELAEYGRRLNGKPFSLAAALTDVLEIEPDQPRFVGTLQGLNDALRRNPDFLSAGIGRFLLRETVPPYVVEVPESLRPVHLSVRDPETDESLDMDMSDEGLEGDSVSFIHAPKWEDVNEEVEVKLPRGIETTTSTIYIVLNHHYRAGTIKLRRMDEELFALEGPLARMSIRAEDAGGVEEVGAWASRESGLIYGLGDWYQSRLPQSGGVLLISRNVEQGVLQLTAGEVDKLTHLDEHRVTELSEMREAATYMSLFELLHTIMGSHAQGLELPTLWSEVNVVRRTSKRLMCSVLSAYHCFYFKQRGPKQILWRFDAGKIDQGFKRNKRKYVRR